MTFLLTNHTFAETSFQLLKGTDGESMSYLKPVGTSTRKTYNESMLERTSQPPHPHTGRPARHAFKKAATKRRKSLPSQNINESDHQAVTLIPRGPLICSNNEGMGLETSFFTKSRIQAAQKINPYKHLNKMSKPTTPTAVTTAASKQESPDSSGLKEANLATPETLDYDLSLMSLVCDPIESPTAENSSRLVGTAAGFMSSKLTSPRSRIYSDFEIRDYTEQSESQVTTPNDEDVFYKLKEEGEVRYNFTTYFRAVYQSFTILFIHY